MKLEPDPETTVNLIAVKTAAERWHRSVRNIFEEIEKHDYHEEQGVYFRHLEKKEWRIHEFLFLHWRRIPVAALGDVKIKMWSEFMLPHLETTLIALQILRRHALAQHELSALNLESVNHHEGGRDEQQQH